MTLRSASLVGPSMRRARLALLWLLACVVCASGFEVARACANDASPGVDLTARRGVDPTPLAQAAPEVRHYHACDEAPPESALEGLDSEESQHIDGAALRAIAVPACIIPVSCSGQPVVRRSASTWIAQVDRSTALPRGPPVAPH